MVRNHYTLNHGNSPTTIPSPTDAGALPPGRGPKSIGVVVGGGVFSRQISVLGDNGEQDGLSAPQVPAPMDLVETGGSLQQSVGLVDAMVSLGKTTERRFPAQ